MRAQASKDPAPKDRGPFARRLDGRRGLTLACVIAGLLAATWAPFAIAQDGRTLELPSVLVTGNLALAEGDTLEQLRVALNQRETEDGLANDLLLVDIDADVCATPGSVGSAPSLSFYQPIDPSRSRTVLGANGQRLDVEVDRDENLVRVLRIESDAGTLRPGDYFDTESWLRVHRFERDADDVLHVDLEFRQTVEGSTQLGRLRVNADVPSALADRAFPSPIETCRSGVLGPASVGGGVVVERLLLDHVRGVANGMWDPTPPQPPEKAIEAIENDTKYLEDKRHAEAKKNADGGTKPVDRSKRTKDAGAPTTPGPSSESTPEIDRFAGGGGGPVPRARPSHPAEGETAVKAPPVRALDAPKTEPTRSMRIPRATDHSYRLKAHPSRVRPEHARADEVQTQPTPGGANADRPPPPPDLDVEGTGSTASDVVLAPPTERPVEPELITPLRARVEHESGAMERTPATHFAPTPAASPGSTSSWFDDTFGEIARFLVDAVAWLAGDAS